MDSSVQEKMQALFIAYTKNLPNKIANIQAQWQLLQKNWNTAGLEVFHRDVHSLTGSSSTYGYIALSKCARKLEIYLKNLLATTSISVEQEQEIDNLLNEITKSLLESAPEKMPDVPIISQKLTNKKILIYDQELANLKEFEQSLQESGYHLQNANDLSQLKQLVTDSKPISLIVDITNFTFEQSNTLAEICSQFEIPLVCVAKNGDLLTRLLAIRSGSNAFFQKPLDLFYLTKTIDQLCGFLPTDPYRILIVDDSASLGEYYSLILNEAGMHAQAITNPLKLMEAIHEFQPDLLIMDIYMPECTGLELAEVLRQEATYTHIPIIFLSTENDKFKQLSALSLGGDDFLTKPILPQHLIAAVKSRAKRAGILNSFIITDSLTGLLNHTNILQRLDIEIARAERKQMNISFVMIDIDHFKAINDNYGHPVGDKVIQRLSSLLATRLRKIDSIGRYGGEEFALILPHTSCEEAVKICNHLREQFSQFNFEVDGKTFSASFSAGIATYPKFKNHTLLIEAADQALYDAKHSGRNQVKTSC